jgi:hypothetical protein
VFGFDPERAGSSVDYFFCCHSFFFCVKSTDGTRKAAQPPSALQGLLGAIGKKSKMSTVTKTALDWDQFKEKEGIAEELKIHNKDGYLQKQAFLHEADLRAHEKELEWKQTERLKRDPPGVRR